MKKLNNKLQHRTKVKSTVCLISLASLYTISPLINNPNVINNLYNFSIDENSYLTNYASYECCGKHLYTIANSCIDTMDSTNSSDINSRCISVIEDRQNILPKPIEWITGYASCDINIRKSPNTDSEILGRLKFNENLKFAEYDEEWYKVEFNSIIAYISKSYVSTEKIPFTSYSISSSGFKSFMPYTSITSVNSSQYKLQHTFAYTGDYGIRQIDNRYCVALGSAVNASMGTYCDLILANGTIIPCILADQKDDKHTLSDNLTTAANGCVSEFLVDLPVFDWTSNVMGDVSYCNDNWKSPVVEIRIYDKNIFD